MLVFYEGNYADFLWDEMLAEAVQSRSDLLQAGGKVQCAPFAKRRPGVHWDSRECVFLWVSVTVQGPGSKAYFPGSQFSYFQTTLTMPKIYKLRWI